MSWIETISSTLRTWVFKRKLLKFSGRFRWEAEACFYCPEMCRFACPVAEATRDNTVTPRAKMSLLHLAERGFGDERIAGSSARRLQLLEQCTGCGRCSEYCVYENLVGAHLREARSETYSKRESPRGGPQSEITEALQGLSGVVLFCEPGRREWWASRPELLSELGVSRVVEDVLPHLDWSWGKLGEQRIRAVGEALSDCTQIWVESPESAWFLAKGVKEDCEALEAEVRVVWQRFFDSLAALELPIGTSVHESWHLTRLFPRLGYSIPMFERGLLPFHHGWNVLDCGGEGFYRRAYPAQARAIGERYIDDLGKDGRSVERIVCQSMSCVEHLKALTDADVVYWLDVIDAGKGKGTDHGH